MTRVAFLRRAAIGAGACALALCVAACADRAAGPAGPGPGTALQILLRGAVTGGTSDAYTRVDAAHVNVTQSGAVLVDTVVSFTGAGDGAITLFVQLPNPTGTVVVDLELTRGGQVLFRGSGSAQLQRGEATSLRVNVLPVVAGVAAPDSVTLTALGDTLRLRGAAVFATGDTVTGTAVSWAGDGGSIVRVTPDGLVTALREGQAQATASYQAVAHTTRVRVQAAVARVIVSPDTFSLAVGAKDTLSAVARDRNGNALQRTFAWRSSNTGVATVDASGVVAGVAVGSAAITATSEGQSGTATVRVAQPVLAVSPTQVSFSLLQGAGSRARSVAVTNAGGGTLSGLTATVSYGAGTSGWLATSFSSTTAPSTLTLVANPDPLAVGTYTATVTVASTLPGAGTAQVSVTLDVQAQQPVIGVSATDVRLTMQFDSTLGYSARDSSVTVFNSGTGTLTGLSAAVSYQANCSLPPGWLTADVRPTTAPATLTLTAIGYVSPTAGPCTATVIITSTSPGAGRATVGVTYGGPS